MANPRNDITLLKTKYLYIGVLHAGAYFGGNANNGSNAGLFYWNLNNTPSNANWNIGSRLILYMNTHAVLLAAWQKFVATEQTSNLIVETLLDTIRESEVIF